jgi:type IV pilus assembly protein PilV
MTSLKSQSGFTLIEVLVALAVVAIGLLGLANLQTIGLRNTTNNRLMLQAIWLTNDIIDRARSNINQNAAGYTDNYSDSNTYKCDNAQAANDPIAAQDRQEWQDIVCRELPNARITLCTDSNPNDNKDCIVTDAIKGITPYMVKLEWDDPTQPDGVQRLIMTFQVARIPDNTETYLNGYKK